MASTYSASNDQPDYFRKYVTIVSLEQCQRYKDDFNAEYEEYRNLHGEIEKITESFRRLGEQRKSLTPGSEAYQMLLHRILADYEKIQQVYVTPDPQGVCSPSYSEMKSRCQYLHRKLSHIRRLISEYDKQRVESWH